MTKLAAHDKWVCLACRWTAKLPLVDIRSADRPSYRCPKCQTKMLWSGTAFRPPRKDDDEAWQVLEKVFATGFRFLTTSQRQRVPRTQKDLRAWLKNLETPDGWLPERRVRIGSEPTRPQVRCGQQVLADGQQVLVFQEGDWHEGRFRLRYGSKELARPVVALTGTRRVVPLASGLRMRLRNTSTA